MTRVYAKGPGATHCAILSRVRLLLLFVVLPAVELALLIQLGKRIGTFETLALIVATGLVGASLARAQGLRVLAQLQSEAQAGRMPAEPIIDGAIILVAGALLVTPGVLTDAFGFACLIPGTRQWIKRLARQSFERAVASGRVVVGGAGFEPKAPGPIIDIEPDPPRDTPPQNR